MTCGRMKRRFPASSTQDVATPSATAGLPAEAEPKASVTPKDTVPVDPCDWPQDATTVMMRNIPNRYTQEDLLEELNGKGFHAAFDYFHLVMDMRTKRNKGYAFLNLRSPVLARQIHAEFNGYHLQRYQSRKVLDVALAEVQGLHANAITYLNAKGDRVQNVWFKPIIFVQTAGQPNEWKAYPLIESNLPEEIARVYGSNSQQFQAHHDAHGAAEASAVGFLTSRAQCRKRNSSAGFSKGCTDRRRRPVG